MSTLLSHLDRLVSASQNTPDTNNWIENEWASILTEGPQGKLYDDEAASQHGVIGEEGGNSADTVLEVFHEIFLPTTTHTSKTEHKPCLLKLRRKPNSEFLYKALYSVLSSDRPNDDVSGEVADIIGFEDIDLAMEVLDYRVPILQELHKDMHLQTEASDAHHLSASMAQRRMEKKFEDNAARPLFSGTMQATPETYPHVYTSTPMAQGNVLSQLGTRYLLPMGTVRQMNEEYEEVIIPPARPVPPRVTERLVPIAELDELARGCFPGYSTLNRVQSIVYPTAYKSNENLLVCAPTGAVGGPLNSSFLFLKKAKGKTDVAMLTILRVLSQHQIIAHSNSQIRDTICRDSFKIIYVAPMKALASEIVRKFCKRLKWLSIEVRELTGDMQMTKSEIAQTQIIVTTPEKWDVVTRKPTGEGELASSIKLLIVDEVHLLNEERGAVIETIVARTLRQVESSQSMIRIVGLSATLPNYVDVADFLCVSRQKGLFYFDSSFRPVPLEQHFLGIKGKAGSALSRKNLDSVTFRKVSELVAQGHQVMVFVHARKETVKTAMGLREMSLFEGNGEDFSCEEHPQWIFFRRQIGESRNREMKQLFDSGFGIHHAGMLRSDRNMMERMFDARAIKVLCCTATLAWGVNLPAHAVIIKGTQVYDSSRGTFVDLSVLDVLQVFGRAGRPGLETSGEGYICTTEDKLPHYLDAVTSQLPIESQFKGGMIDALNAEISLGTVANTTDAVQWLGYTYLFVRMRKNPFIYGISRESTGDDPNLGSKRNELITVAAQKLADARMILFDHASGGFTISDLGRIAAKYYIRHTSIEIFNAKFRPKMSEADILAMLCMSTEFEQIQVRETEIKELEMLMGQMPCDVKGGTDTSAGKVNILLQAFISRAVVEDFALVSDMAYAAQNGGRIVRALLEIAISRKWSHVAAILMGLSKAIEKRLWPFEQPLKQFVLKPECLHGLQEWADECSVVDLASLDATALGKLVHLNEHHGLAILNAAKQFPVARITYDLKPLGSDVLKLALHVERAFTWNTKVHGSAEPFWLWVEDHEGLTILQMTHLAFHQTSSFLKVDFVIAIPDGHPPPSLTLRWVSDRWVGAEMELPVPLDGLIMPDPPQCHSSLISLPFLSISVCHNSVVEALSGRLDTLNNIQTQCFWLLSNTKLHSLLCGPAGSGKSTLVQLAIWSNALRARGGCTLIVTPQRSVATETVAELKLVSQAVGFAVEYSADEKTLVQPKTPTIRVATSTHLLRLLSGRNPFTPIPWLDLVICENLEQLDATYELGISLLLFATQSAPTRFVGVSQSINDPVDLADWISVNPIAICSFRPRDRDQSLSFSAQTFTIPHSASLFKAMAKPAHSAIRSVPLKESAIIFVPSQGQSRTIARELITQCSLETETARGYLPNDVADEFLQSYCARLQDTTLIDFISKGVGFFHGGIKRGDRNVMLELYAEGILRVLIVPRESCWSLPLRAAVVVVMGTQYTHVEPGDTLRQTRDYSITELVRMQSRAVRHTGTGHFHLFCQVEALDTFMRFLNDGVPLESQLHESPVLETWYKTQRVVSPDIASKQQLTDILSFTFFSRRIARNPSYYGFSNTKRDESLSRIVDKLLNDDGGTA